MDCFHSLNDLNHQEVLRINELRVGSNAAKTVQLSASKRQQTEVIVMGAVFDQQVPFKEDEGVNTELLIADPNAEGGLLREPICYADWFSFLDNFILGTPNRSNTFWRLRLLFATGLVIAILVGIRFYPDNLGDSKIIQGPLDPSVQYIPYPFSSRGVFINSSNFAVLKTNPQIPLPKHNTSFNTSMVFVAYSGTANHQISLPQQNTGMFEYIVDFILGPNRSDPIWRLRLLAAFSLIVHATVGVLFLPGDLQGVHATYRSTMLITSFAAPIVVAVITLLISFWLVTDRDGQSNWITGLSVVNFSMLGGRLPVYWAFKRET